MCRAAAISEASYYNWKAKYGGMEAADIKKIKDLEDENHRLKQMFADLVNDHYIWLVAQNMLLSEVGLPLVYIRH